MRELPWRRWLRGMGCMLAGLYVKSTLEEGQLFTISRRKLAPGGSVCPLPARPPRCQSIKEIAKLEKVKKKKKMVNTLSELGSACLSGELEKERGKVFVLWKRRSNKALSSSQALIRPLPGGDRGNRYQQRQPGKQRHQGALGHCFRPVMA